MKKRKNLFSCLSLFVVSLCSLSLMTSCGKKDEKPSTSVSQTVGFDPSKYNCISLADAISIATAAGETATEEKFYVTGKVKTISNSIYGEMTITDGKDELFIYGTYSKDGVKRYSELEEKPVAGDDVVLYGALNFFKEKPQIRAGWIQEFRHNAPVVTPGEYVEKTIAQAREDEAGAKVQLSGVVAKITYANGMIPNGFYLIDNTGSIYVYGEAAGQVKEGNKVTLVAEKTYYILDKEIEDAKKYGYKGCCQVTFAQILSNDNGNTPFDTSWIKEATVKEIMDTPVTSNITTNVYKVNARVRKSLGTGFVNYYMDDLDEKTGSYVYTACNGSDFAYLDEFDGKICTVYLSPINAKSTNAGCLFRFIPLSVKDENYQFDLKDTPKFVADYYAVDQFESSYSADPSLKLITTVSSTLLGFENATINYVSNNTNVISFENENNEMVMHTKNEGETTIIISTSYLTYQYQTSLSIKVEKPVEGSYVNVKAAIDALDNEEVTVKGIASGSLINQTGFYLIDETGVIAIRTDKETMSKISIGNMVIMKGTRAHFKQVVDTEGNITVMGQSVLLDSTLVSNLYGEHDYSKATFDSSKSVQELYELDVVNDYTTQVFSLDVKVEFITGGYSSNIKLLDPTSDSSNVKLNLYCSSADNQYGFMKPFNGQVVTVEIVACNWNNKSFYSFCVLSVTTSDGTTIINNYNYNN